MTWEKEAEQFGADPQRVAVWDALSEFYLDTELSKDDLERIARILARSPFSLEELRHIEIVEVDPVCKPNLSHPAGEWAMFDPEWLIPCCLEKQQSNTYVPGGNPSLANRLLWAAVPSNIPQKRIEEIRLSAQTEE